MIVTFRFGGGSRIGGEGMALWLVEKPETGPVLGGADYWKGLAIFIDTYDNDGQVAFISSLLKLTSGLEGFTSCKRLVQ